MSDGVSTPQARKGDLGTRLAVAAVGIPLGFFVVWWGGWVLAGVLLLLAVGGAHEVLGFARARGIEPFPFLALPAAAAVVVAAPLSGGEVALWAPWVLAILLLTGLGGLALSVFLRGPDRHPLAATAVTLLAPLWVALPLAFAWFLRHHPGAQVSTQAWAGTGLLLLPMISTWLGDTTAYFGGRAFGRRKLLPSVSPAKTVEGSATGLLGSVGGALLVVGLLFPVLGGGEGLTLLQAGLIGLLIGGVAQVGDLAESVLKREAGIKDSGSILPGHGGILDRFDAVFLTLPLTWALLLLFLELPA